MDRCFEMLTKFTGQQGEAGPVGPIGLKGAAGDIGRPGPMGPQVNIKKTEGCNARLSYNIKNFYNRA